MSENTVQTETAEAPYQRVFWPRDYARFADALRRARKGKTPQQLEIVDAATTVLASIFAGDYDNAPAKGFDVDKFTASAKLRVETVHNDEYRAWAEKHGADPEAAAENQQKFYDNRYSPGNVSDDPDLGYDPDDDEDDDDEDDDDDSLL